MAILFAGREEIRMHTFAARRLRLLAIEASFAGLVVLSLSRHAAASELRCGGRLVLPGDSAADVLEKCGPPASLQRLGGRDLGAAKPASAKPSKSADREVWTYASAGQLARHLTFRKGRVAQIDVGGYAR